MNPFLEKDLLKLNPETNFILKLLPEIKTPVFLTSSSFILALFVNFYKLPLYLTVFPPFLYLCFVLFRRKNRTSLFWWCLYFLTFFIITNFLLMPYPKASLQLHTENLIKTKRDEPYFQGFIVYGYNPVIGDIVFKTKDLRFKPGEVCLLKLALSSRNILNPFSISKEEFLKSKGIVAEVKLLSKKPFCKKETASFFESLRYRLFTFSEEMPPLARGLFRALVLGVKNSLPPEYLKKLKAQGVYHLLAISGFHLAVVFGIFYFVFLFFLRHLPLITQHPFQNIAGISALPFTFLVIGLSGFCPSALRAFLFLCLFIFTRFFFKDTTSLVILFLTAVLSLLFQPYLIGNLSFQLSFLAVFSLILGDRIFKKYLLNIFLNPEFHSEKASKIFKFLINKIFYSIFVSLIVSLILSPIIIYMAGSFPLATPLNNLIAGFFWSFLFIPLSFIIAFLSFFFPSLALSLSHFLEKCFHLYLAIPLPSPCFIPEIPVNLIFLTIVLSFSSFFIFYCFVLKRKNFKKIPQPILMILFFCINLSIFYKTFLELCERVPAIIFFDTPGEVSILFKTGRGFQQNYFLFATLTDAKSSFKEWTLSRISASLKKLGINEFSIFEFKNENIFPDVYSFFLSQGLKVKRKPLFEDSLFLRTPEGKAEFFFFKNPFLFYAEVQGLTFLYSKEPQLKKLFLAKLKRRLIFSEVCLFKSGSRLFAIKNYQVLQWLKPRFWIMRDVFKNGAFYLFPEKTYFLICTEAGRRKNFWTSLFFPFVPYYMGGRVANCRKVFYHKSRRHFKFKRF